MRSDVWATAKILIVDDEPTNVRLLQRLLTISGYREVEGTTDSREALTRFRAFRPDLVLLDLTMPHLDGVAVLEQLRADLPPEAFVPVLVLTADVTLDAKRRALEAGANDFLTKPFEQTEVLLRIGNLLATRRLYLDLDAQNRSLEETVRQRTERLLQSEKVATMGSLLAGVAHELNNPLAILSGHAQLLQESNSDPTIMRRAAKIDEAAARCVRIVRSFLALARQRPPERTQVSLRQIVDEAIELLAYELRTDDVELRVDIPGDVPTFWADAHQLHQVIVNLVGNAQQAMRRAPAPRHLTITARHDPTRRLVTVNVEDTGPGIPPEIQAKIFEPFFTTKRPGEGTGLGLSLCRGIVEEHGGTIRVASTPGSGTRFTIELPLVQDATPSLGHVDERSAVPVTPKRLLIVDDEPEVAAVIAETLQRDGHATTVARDGATALAMFNDHSYDLVVSDTKMPGLDGEEFYGQLVKRFPAMRDRIVFLTGDVLSREKREFLEATQAPFLTKPCDLADVRRVVNQVLGR